MQRLESLRLTEPGFRDIGALARDLVLNQTAYWPLSSHAIYGESAVLLLSTDLVGQCFGGCVGLGRQG